jgi:hypothetical protein
MNWLYQGKEYTEIHDPDVYGFIYYIITQDGKRYIGKRQFYQYRKKSARKKTQRSDSQWLRISPTQLRKESNWRNYYSSCPEITKSNTTQRIILDFAYDKKHLGYLELKHQLQYNVLEDDRYLNSNIAGKYFRKDLPKKEQPPHP